MWDCCTQSDGQLAQIYGNSNLVVVILLDLSKAFEFVDHDILLSKISFIKPVLSAWIGLNELNHTYRNVINFVLYLAQNIYTPLTGSCGVPHGSVLGPVVFSIYINDLHLNILKANVDVNADDTTLKIQNDLQNSLNCGNLWFEQNHMNPILAKLNIYYWHPSEALRHASIFSFELNL